MSSDNDAEKDIEKDAEKREPEEDAENDAEKSATKVVEKESATALVPSSEQCWDVQDRVIGKSSRQVALAQDIAVAKEIRAEKKERFFDAATDNRAAPKTLVVKLCWGSAAIAVLLLVLFVGYSLLQTQSSDTTLEDKIMSGDKLESLKALRQHSIQNLFSTFVIVVGVLLLGVFAGFGLLLYFKDTTQHQAEKRLEIVRAASSTFEFSEDMMSQLTASLTVEIATAENLKREVDQYTAEIEKLSEEGTKHREKIEELQEQKAKKEADLAAAQATVRETQKSLGEAKAREEELKEDVRNKEDTIRKEQQESSRARTEASSLQDNLRRTESEASSLRSRARYLESQNQDYVSRAHCLELDKARLQEEVKRKPSSRTTWYLL